MSVFDAAFAHELALMQEREITLDLARAAISRAMAIGIRANPRVVMFAVVAERALCNAVDPAHVMDVNFHAPSVRRARNEAWLTLYDTHGLTLTTIADFFSVHHTSVLYAIRKERARNAQPQ